MCKVEYEEKNIPEDVSEGKSWIDELELRALKSTDIAPVCRIISAIGIKEFRSCFEGERVKSLLANGKLNAESVGIGVMFEIAGVVVQNIPKADADIQKFAASVSGMTVSKIQEMSFTDYVDLIIRIIKKDEFRDFFSRVARLFK